MKCEICKKEFKNIKSIANHIKIHNLSSNEYYDIYLKKENEGICLICHNKTLFKNIINGYKKYCSIKCSNKSEHNPFKNKEIQDKIKQTNIKKYGVDNPLKNKEIQEKQNKTILEKYGVKNISQSECVKEKKKQTSIKNWGVDNPNKNKKVRDKINKTNLERYKVNNPFKNKEIQEKQKQTCLKKYGVYNPNKNSEVRKKLEQTNIKKYGVENVFQNEETREKIKKTNLERYGVEKIFKSKIIREKIKKTNLERYGVKNIFECKEIKEKIKKISYDRQLYKVIKILKYNNSKLLSDYTQNRELIKLECLKCSTIFETQYFYVQQGFGKCPNCFPKFKSQGEIELLEFIKSIESSEIIENDRKVLNGQELDIYIPSKNIAIEFNGLYWHSELFKDKNYHLNKTELCEKNNIRLIHIFEDEWSLYKENIKKLLFEIIIEDYDLIPKNNFIYVTISRRFSKNIKYYELLGYKIHKIEPKLYRYYNNIWDCGYLEIQNN
jgi:hypothetical protein